MKKQITSEIVYQLLENMIVRGAASTISKAKEKECLVKM